MILVMAVVNSRPITWPDLARIAGAAAVVMIHVTANVVVAYGGVGIKQWWLANLLDSAMRWSVPLFVMLSGSFLLDPKVPRPLPQFLKRRVARVILPLIFWATTYYMWLSMCDHVHVNLSYIAKGTMAGIPYSHLYFLFLIFGLYLVTPMLRIYVMHASRRNMLYCLLVLFSFGAINSYITYWWGLGNGLNMTSQFIPYIGYYLAGYFFRDVVLPRKQGHIAGAVFLLLIGLTAISTYVLTAKFGIGRGLFLYEYLSFTVIPEALLLYLWFNSVVSEVPTKRFIVRHSKAIGSISAATFGIYLVHPLVIDALSKVGIGPTEMAPGMGILVTYVATILASTLIILFLRKIPYLKLVVL
jgi:surface polysaccharide O-acyltransferase-like enzyme